MAVSTGSVNAAQVCESRRQAAAPPTGFALLLGVVVAISAASPFGLNVASASEPRPLLLLSDKDYPPITYLDDSVAKGMEVDLGKALAKPLGREVQIELMAWHLAQEKVLRGEADGLLAMSMTGERMKLYDFTSTTFTREFGLFVRSGDVTIRAANDLTGKRVGVTQGGYPREFLEAQPGVTLVLIEDYKDGFDRLAAGTIEAVAGDLWVGAYTIQTHRVRGITLAGDPFARLPAGVAIRKGNPALLKELNRGIQALTEDGTISRIHREWRPREMMFLSRATIQAMAASAIGAFLFVLLGAMALWVVTLKRQIRVRREAESALRQSEERLRVALSAAEMGTWRWTPSNDQDIRDAGLNRILGLEAAESTQGIEEFLARVHPDDRAAVKAAVERSVEEGGTYLAEFRVIRPDGAVRWLRGRGRTFYRESGDRAHLTGAVVDITERKRADEEIGRLLAQVQEDAAELEKRVAERTAQLNAANAELGAFAYSVSHDLKAPLRGIDGYSRLLLEDHAPKLEEEGRFYVRTIRAATERMTHLIDDLLAYARLERRTLMPGAVQLRSFVDALLAGYSGEVQSRGVTLKASVPETAVQVDADGLGLALRNVIENALKFTRNVSSPSIEIGAYDTEDSSVVWVRDNGIGFDMRYHDRIYEIFHRLQRSEDFPGTGIGLALARKAMERMGGRVWAESKPNDGATFFLEIPR